MLFNLITYTVKKDKCFLICENINESQRKMYNNIFRVNHDSEKSSLSFETSDTNTFSIELIVKTKFLLLPLTFGKVSSSLSCVLICFIKPEYVFNTPSILN